MCVFLFPIISISLNHPSYLLIFCVPHLFHSLMEGAYIWINWSTAMHRSSSYQTLLRCYLDFISSWLIPFDPCRVSCILKLERRKKKTYVRLVMCKVVVGRPVTTNDDVCVAQGRAEAASHGPRTYVCGCGIHKPSHVCLSLVFFLSVYSYMFLFFYRKKLRILSRGLISSGVHKRQRPLSILDIFLWP